MKRPALIVLLVIAIVVGGRYLLHRFARLERSFSNAPRTYSLDAPASVLSESLAVATAKRVMIDEGYDLSQWQLAPDTRFSTPQQLLNQGDDKRFGEVTFTNPADPRRLRFVNLEIDGAVIRAQVTKPK